MNLNNTINKCSEILSSQCWLGGPESHARAESEINDLLTSLYLEHEPEQLLEALNALEIGYQRTVIVDRLSMLEAAEDLNAYESELIEMDESELQAMFDSGQAEELTENEAQQIIDASRRKAKRGMH